MASPVTMATEGRHLARLMVNNLNNVNNNQGEYNWARPFWNSFPHFAGVAAQGGWNKKSVTKEEVNVGRLHGQSAGGHGCNFSFSMLISVTNWTGRRPR